MAILSHPDLLSLVGPTTALADLATNCIRIGRPNEDIDEQNAVSQQRAGLHGEVNLAS